MRKVFFLIFNFLNKNEVSLYRMFNEVLSNLKRSVDMTSSGMNGFNIRPNASQVQVSGRGFIYSYFEIIHVIKSHAYSSNGH